MASKKIQELLTKYLINQASSSELDELELWVKNPDNEREFSNYVKTNFIVEYNLKQFNSDNTRKKLDQLIKEEKRLIRLKRIQKYSKYAAAIIIGLFVTAYFFKYDLFSESVDDNVTPVIVNTNIIAPGTDKATLTLANGEQVPLEKGASFQTSNANSNGEQIVYEAGGRKTKELVYNYLTIPRGGQFYIVLSDGTKVWLNSESQLKYPVSFIEGETRQVELVYGEAYFDVTSSAAHNGSKFIVLNKSQEVEVLGTEFNIKAYRDETNIYTTLVEGKVTVGYDNKKQNLTPNLQSILDVVSNTVSVAEVDVESEISWKEGVFSFKGKPLKDIMKVISRWYDVDVAFKNKQLEDITFKGVLGKNQNLEEILTTIQTLSIIKNYEINGKTITLE
ncbi:FecR family protein [Seonamhaeicola sp.]|uniref:FecR family protein n=1 Tax=Seonamhaeicola sp. TaxID=1912245 RepID=UPI00261B59FC|nr:FecR family protein [Seonamhaeicola sp.]